MPLLQEPEGCLQVGEICWGNVKSRDPWSPSRLLFPGPHSFRRYKSVCRASPSVMGLSRSSNSRPRPWFLFLFKRLYRFENQLDSSLPLLLPLLGYRIFLPYRFLLLFRTFDSSVVLSSFHQTLSCRSVVYQPVVPSTGIRPIYSPITGYWVGANNDPISPQFQPLLLPLPSCLIMHSLLSFHPSQIVT